MGRRTSAGPFFIWGNEGLATENTESGTDEDTFVYCSPERCGYGDAMEGSSPGGLLYENETFLVRGAAFHVYRAMGPGFLEAVYQECLELELSRRGVPFEAAKALSLTYRGHPLRQTYVADLICYRRIIVELKAVRSIAPEHRAQTINYLRATGVKLGLLINFGSPQRAEIERFVL
jgi:GxxExxY protein